MSEKIRICRACLATNVDLHNIYEGGLYLTLAKLLGIFISATDGMPPYLCGVCTQLLRKFKMFRDRCYSSSKMLQRMILHNESDQIKNVDRGNMFNLKKSKTETHSFQSIKPELTLTQVINIDTAGVKTYYNKKKENHYMTFTHNQKCLDSNEVVIKQEKDNDLESHHQDLGTVHQIVNLKIEFESDNEYNELYPEVKVENDDILYNEDLFNINESHDKELNNEIEYFHHSNEGCGNEFKNAETSFDNNVAILNNNEANKNDVEAFINDKIVIVDHIVNRSSDETCNNEETAFDDDVVTEADDETSVHEEPIPKEPEIIITKNKKIQDSKVILQKITTAKGKKRQMDEIKIVKLSEIKRLKKSKTEKDKALFFKQAEYKKIQKNKQLEKLAKIERRERKLELKKLTGIFHEGLWGKMTMRKMIHRQIKHYEEFAKKCNFDIKYLTKEEQVKQFEEKKKRYEQMTYQCHMCYQGYASKHAYDTHLLIHDHESGDHECGMCRTRYRTNSKLLSHMRRTHFTHFTCKVCGKVVKNVKTGRDHSNRHLDADGVHKCEICHRGFRSKNNYFDHQRNVHNNDAVACPICNKSFRGIAGVAGHMSKKHRRAVQCDTCQVYFETKTAVIKHLENSKDGVCIAGIRACKRCGEGFETEELLTEHYLQHTPNFCDMCNIKFRSSRGLCNHWKYHHSPGVERPKRRVKSTGSKEDYVCEICGMAFSYINYFESHMRLHTGEKPFKCTYCEKTFRTQSTLYIHTRVHTDVRRYKCTICPKAFRQGQHLTAHIRTHTKERPYVCMACPKRYRASASLKEHVDVIHKGLPTRQRNK